MRLPVHIKHRELGNPFQDSFCGKIIVDINVTFELSSGHFGLCRINGHEAQLTAARHLAKEISIDF